MPRAKKPQQQPDQVIPQEVTPVVIPEEIPQAASVPQSNGIPIEYIGDGAEQVNFTPNPKATRIQVYANGIVVETF